MISSDQIVLLITAFAGALAAGFSAYHAYKTNGRLETYRLEVNSRMDQFIAVVKEASYAAGQKSMAVEQTDPQIAALAAAKVLEASATAASRALDAAATRAAMIIHKTPDVTPP